MRMETGVRILGNLAKFLSNYCERPVVSKRSVRQHSIENFFRSANFFRPLRTVPARFLDDFERSAGLYLSLVYEIFVKGIMILD